MPYGNEPRVALCLPGGGATGAMFQMGALAALEDAVDGLDANDFDFYIGTSSGASIAAALAGGRPVQRMYRAFLDPADTDFELNKMLWDPYLVVSLRVCHGDAGARLRQ